MRILRTIEDVRSTLGRGAGTVGFVPTMGAFHEGHASLMRAARAECDTLVVSVFVNPAQFPDREVYLRYPRDPEGDAALAEREGADLLFLPEPAEVYPPGFATAVSVTGGPAAGLCGAGLGTDGQLTGMCTVIVKLLNIVGPDTVYFGEKDLPHWIAVRRMAADLNLPARIRVLPTVREADGVAMSSRNVHLGAHRPLAACLPRALDAALGAVAAGLRDTAAIRARAAAELSGPLVAPDYVEVLDAASLRPLAVLDRPAVIAVGATVAGVPLLDLARCAVPAGPPPRPAPAERVDGAAR
ncbi:MULTISPECIES: pantoate--beta-alanine ligase [Kitasatospora]|uniref:Pantothenate synthetase n=1 Tax=Kitasatospora setae (strain ATCC 33774 / DSM 43861 / JCM 3304 / KCC A-0304 / NBRC 14216 / KM-6054) TaxID=452652 RepID=E4N468_KITSK|nr:MULTISPECIES: pantoate--beta-alanine ligase [Kitasatospora]BAJ25999.1 putative pantoate--beta-alanine ligase [Kitasatospora setae KM-6054]